MLHQGRQELRETDNLVRWLPFGRRDKALSGPNDPCDERLGEDLGALAEPPDTLRKHLDKCRRRRREREKRIERRDQCVEFASCQR